MMLKKKIIYFIIFVCIFLFLLLVYIKPIIIFIVGGQLEDKFLGSKAIIGSCNLESLNSITLSDISIKQNSVYDFKIKKIKIQYSLASIIQKNILEVYLGDVEIKVNSKKGSINQLEESLHNMASSKGLFSIKYLNLEKVKLNLKLNSLDLESEISLKINLLKKIMDYCYFRITNLSTEDFELKDFDLEANQLEKNGKFSIGQVKYNKLKISGIKSSVRLENNILYFDYLSANVFGADLLGDLKLVIDNSIEYEANLELVNLALESLIEDLDLKEKVKAKGRIGGKMLFKGKGIDIDNLDGDFMAIEPGGTLTINDDKYLKNMAERTNQKLDVIMESFKNYNYNTGIIKLFLADKNLVFNIYLGGEAGKRDLKFIIHDFSLKGGAK